MSLLHPFYICLLLVGICSSAPPISTPDPGAIIDPRPHDVTNDDTGGVFDVDFEDVLSPSVDDDGRYVGYCGEKLVKMWPGNSRKFWSYGYVILKEPYPANCTMKYAFTTMANPNDAFAKYGFKVTGTFTGPNIAYTSCSETDYVTINDTSGVTATYCGIDAVIDYTTGSDYFEFYFITKEDSPGALGFYVVIESFYLCGGLLTASQNGPTGVITSPLYSAAYPPDQNCAWYFTALDETTIRLECHSFLLEDQLQFDNGTSYCPDYLSVSYEVGTPDEVSIYCNSDMDILSKTIYSAGNTLFVTFRSNENNHFSGFNCTYDFILYAV